MTEHEYERVAGRDELPEGALLGVETPAGRKICLINAGGTIHAVADQCTHQEFPMSAGQLVDGCLLECIWHGARFDLDSGAVRHPPASKPLPVYHVRVADGAIWVGPRKT